MRILQDKNCLQPPCNACQQTINQIKLFQVRSKPEQRDCINTIFVRNQDNELKECTEVCVKN